MAFTGQYIRVMIVDYDPDIVDRIKDMFSIHPTIKISYIAQTGKEAIEVAKQAHPDAVIVAHALLDSNGLEVIENIRKVSPQSICFLTTDTPTMSLWERAKAIGVPRVFPKPLNAQEIAPAIEETMESFKQEYNSQKGYLPQIQLQEGPQKIQTVRRTTAMVISPKGGVGKTTMAVNMACATALQNKLGLRVALIDLNEFGTVTIHLNLGSPEKILFGEGTSRNILGWEHIDTNATLNDIEQFMVMHKDTGLWVVPSVPQPEMIARVTEDLIIKVMNMLKNYFDLVIVDLPPSINLEPSWATTALADYILLVVTPDVQCIPGMSQINRTLDRLGVTNKCYRIINMYGLAGGLTMEDMDKYMPYPVLGTIVEDAKIRRAVRDGIPLTVSQPNGDFAVSMKTMVNKIFPVFPESHLTKEKKGFFRKLFFK